MTVREAGFSLHAATRAGAFDEGGREALLKYVLRPPLANERLLRGPDGLVRIALKKPFSDGTVAVDLDPLSLLCRLVALVPAPRFYTVRYFGVLAPAAKWRPLVVPKPPPPATTQDASSCAPRENFSVSPLGRALEEDVRDRRRNLPRLRRPYAPARRRHRAAERRQVPAPPRRAYRATRTCSAPRPTVLQEPRLPPPTQHRDLPSGGAVRGALSYQLGKSCRSVLRPKEVPWTSVSADKACSETR